jgi:hypothetical protein
MRVNTVTGSSTSKSKTSVEMWTRAQSGIGLQPKKGQQGQRLFVLRFRVHPRDDVSMIFQIERAVRGFAESVLKQLANQSKPGQARP